MMKLSDLMNLPNWRGRILLGVHKDIVQLNVASDGLTLNFHYRGATFSIHDQEAEIHADGRIFIRVKSRNRLSRILPTGISIYLIDDYDNVINPHKIPDSGIPIARSYPRTDYGAVLSY